jgi:hypothetical protein
MKINHPTELMKNQKHAVIMSPEKQFRVLQTQCGNPLFFSIGTDNVFSLPSNSITKTPRDGVFIPGFFIVLHITNIYFVAVYFCKIASVY